jgi:hypothetical protein
MNNSAFRCHSPLIRIPPQRMILKEEKRERKEQGNISAPAHICVATNARMGLLATFFMHTPPRPNEAADSMRRHLCGHLTVTPCPGQAQHSSLVDSTACLMWFLQLCRHLPGHVSSVFKIFSAMVRLAGTASYVVVVLARTWPSISFRPTCGGEGK